MAKVQLIEQSAVTAPGYPPCTEFYVYHGDKLLRVCPSRAMAEEVAAGAGQ
jgi:hypothetical protein